MQATRRQYSRIYAGLRIYNRMRRVDRRAEARNIRIRECIENRIHDTTAILWQPRTKASQKLPASRRLYWHGTTWARIEAQIKEGGLIRPQATLKSLGTEKPFYIAQERRFTPWNLSAYQYALAASAEDGEAIWTGLHDGNNIPIICEIGIDPGKLRFDKYRGTLYTLLSEGQDGKPGLLIRRIYQITPQTADLYQKYKSLDESFNAEHTARWHASIAAAARYICRF